MNHTHILFTLLRLMALGMDVPEETFVDMHGYDEVGESSLRFLKYYPRSVEKTNIYLKGHTDTAVLTLLWSQPISGLQILSKNNKWRHIKHLENSIIINSGDAMKFLSGGFYEPTVHRVIQAPQDQVTLERPIVFYSVMASEHVKLAPVKGNLDGKTEVDVPTMGEWRKARSTRFGTGTTKASEYEDKVEEEVILGRTIKEYV
ncbi:hypothetical protein D9757_003321 [Collybiopsis confluens]|uniref:Isopenicillin N synthase-like Fe(2+) 2OG dioxygenase domain-containing protein n=1 Tax=Collybiopsis confluens TaxID=2823264 RepID=A0A8H5HZ66_9AGAR|nr:hypothetical protein D9757_003321 [Collybiopsis confluens]